MANTAASNNGVVRLASHHGVVDTGDRLQDLLEQKGIMLFARIDFSRDAAAAGLTMRPEQLLIFGNPKAGTPLMVSQPTVGIDLPLKALIWEDADGKTWIAYNDPQYIVHRHEVAPELSANLAAVIPLLQLAAQ